MDVVVEPAIESVSDAGPEWVLLALLVIVVGILLYNIIPLMQKYMEAKTTKIQHESEAHIRLEETREQRKNEESQARMEHDREMAIQQGKWMELYDRSVSSMDRSTAAIEAMQHSLDTNTELLKLSQERSAGFSNKVDSMASKIERIERGVERIESNGQTK